MGPKLGRRALPTVAPATACWRCAVLKAGAAVVIIAFGALLLTGYIVMERMVGASEAPGNMSGEHLSTRCCIVGGGPCGLMLGLSAGARRRRCRSCWRSTPTSCAISAATPSILRRSNSWASSACSTSFCSCRTRKHDHWRLLRRPRICRSRTSRHLPTRCKFVALMPQWDFLNFLAEHGKRYPSSICGCGRKRSI